MRSFYACLLDPMNKDWVCIDRHAKSAALGRPVRDHEASIRDKEYEVLEKALHEGR